MFYLRNMFCIKKLLEIAARIFFRNSPLRITYRLFSLLLIWLFFLVILWFPDLTWKATILGCLLTKRNFLTQLSSSRWRKTKISSVVNLGKRQPPINKLACVAARPANSLASRPAAQPAGRVLVIKRMSFWNTIGCVINKMSFQNTMK